MTLHLLASYLRRLPVRGRTHHPDRFGVQEFIHSFYHPHVLHLALFVDDKVHQHLALYAVFHSLCRIAQVNIYPLLQEIRRVAGTEEGRFHVTVAEGYNLVGSVAQLRDTFLPECRSLAVRQIQAEVVDEFKFPLHILPFEYRRSVAIGVVFRIHTGREEH